MILEKCLYGCMCVCMYVCVIYAVDLNRIVLFFLLFFFLYSVLGKKIILYDSSIRFLFYFEFLIFEKFVFKFF